jgi:dipeptidyl aminopeptidase/acylaminoacyl peptidase
MYSIRVVNGAPEGKPALVRKDVVLPDNMPVATQDGNYYYIITTNESANVYVVDLDPATGKAVSKPVRLNKTFVDQSAGPAMWSPDGKLLAFSKDVWSSASLMIRSADTGEERELTVSPPFDANALLYPSQWFPDGRSLLARVHVRDHIVFSKVDLQTGKQKPFFEWPGSESLQPPAALSLDGKIFFFELCKPDASQPAGSNAAALNSLRLMRRNMESGEEKELFQAKSPKTGFPVLTLSPDGRQLAFARFNTDNTASLLTMPVDGGIPLELYRSNLLSGGSRTWTKDGTHILVVQSDPKSGMQQLWSVPAKGGEPIYTGVSFPIIGLANFHPDGRRLIYIGRQPGQTELWVMKLLPPGTKPSR